MRFLLLAWLLMVYLRPSEGARGPKPHKWTIKNTQYVLNPSKYKTVAYIAHLTRLVFAVKAARDGHVLLSHSRDLSKDGYEYVIGGYGNTETLIREPINRGTTAHKMMMNMLHPRKYMWFWLDWSDGKNLKTGTGTDPSDPSTTTLTVPFTVKSLRFLSFSAYGNTVYYQILKGIHACFLRIEGYNENADNNCPYKLQGVHYHGIYNPKKELNPNAYTTIGYIGSSNSLLLLVKAKWDGHIVLSTTKDLKTNLFEYVIGAWANKETLFRYPIYGRLLAKKIRHGSLHPYLYRWFWLDWSNGLTLSAGYGSNPHNCATKTVEVTRKFLPGAIPRFLSVSAWGNMVKYKIPKAANRCYLSLAEYNNRRECGKGIKGVNAKKCVLWGCCWDSQANFCYIKPHSEYSWSIHNPFFKLNDLTYEVIGYIGGMTSLVIQIRGSRDGHVLLTKDIYKRSHIVEWVIGGNNDKETLLRSPIYGTTLAIDRSKKNKITSQNYNYFWLDWRSSYVRVGEGATLLQTQWLLTTRPTNRRDHKYVSVSAYGNTVDYRIFKSQNPCFLTLEEYKTRVECGDNANQSRCAALRCCWDKFDNFCYFRSSG